jgi:hypothetical protein
MGRAKYSYLARYRGSHIKPEHPDVYTPGYCVVKASILLVTPSLLPLESIDSTV